MREDEECSPGGSPVGLSDSRREVTLILRSLGPSSSLWPWPSLQLLITDPGGCSSTDSEQQDPHCMDDRSSVEKGILTEVLPRTWRVFSLSAAGGVYGQWAYVLALKDTTQLWGTVWWPTRVFRACCLAPDSLYGGFDLTNTCNTTHDLDAVASASRRVQLLPWRWWTGWCEEEKPQLLHAPVYCVPEGGILCIAGTGHRASRMQASQSVRTGGVAWPFAWTSGPEHSTRTREAWGSCGISAEHHHLCEGLAPAYHPL